MKIIEHSSSVGLRVVAYAKIAVQYLTFATVLWGLRHHC
jgi:hypothetical protein